MPCTNINARKNLILFMFIENCLKSTIMNSKKVGIEKISLGNTYAHMYTTIESMHKYKLQISKIIVKNHCKCVKY